jgi:hypothetical protein
MVFVMLAVTPIAGRGGGGDRRKLDHDDLDAVGVLDLHFGQAPGLGGGFPDDVDCGRGQPGVLGVDIAYLDPDHHRVPGGRVPGDLEQARAEEEHHPGIVWMAELPVDGQAQYVAVEAAAARSLLRNSCAAAAAEPALLCGSGGFGWQRTLAA